MYSYTCDVSKLYIAFKNQAVKSPTFGRFIVWALKPTGFN